jgi:1-aminocyclopropane-1-carboxylate deaminase/D-cysteine desulfhydrase-like pyridoxal-dependent ACC family enzyme
VTVFGGFCSALTTQPVVLPAGASSSAAASRFDAAIKAVESQSSSTLESVVAVAGPSSSLAAQVMEITSQTKYTLICNAFKDGIPFVAVGANPGSA